MCPPGRPVDDLVRRHATITGMEAIITSTESTRDQILEAVRERRHCLEALLRIADRRARLLIDAPIKVEQTVTEVEPQDLELASSYLCSPLLWR
jgi:hypothetical protein